MAKARNHSRYELRDKGKIVYVGITRDPERREEEHKDEGKRFGSMNVVGPKVTHAGAEEWEEERLEQYRRSHGGKNPRYNETDK